MAIHPDILAGALQDLSEEYTETYLRSIPTFNYFLGPADGEGAKGKMEQAKLKGPYKQFSIIKNGPGASINAPTGDEYLAGVRRAVATNGNEYTALHVYYYNISGKDLMQSNGENDLVKIINNLPKLALADDKAIVSRQIVRGASSAGSDPVSQGAAGITTLNGLQTYNPEGTARQGIFQFVAPASQTATVHGAVLQAGTNGVTGWYHQYGHTNSFGTDGMKKYRDLVRLCDAQGLKFEQPGVDVVFADPATWSNMLEHHDGQVTMINKTDYPLAKFMNRDGFKVGNVDWYADDDIDLTDTTAFDGSAGGLKARQGVAYILSSSFWEMIFQSNNSDKMGNGFFDMAQHVLLQDQIHWQFRIISNFNYYCTSLRNQAVLTGGANE